MDLGITVVMISTTIRLTLLGSRAMHMQTSSQAEVPNGPGALHDPCACVVASSTFDSAKPLCACLSPVACVRLSHINPCAHALGSF